MIPQWLVLSPHIYFKILRNLSFKVVVPKIRSLKKKFSYMIQGLEKILSVMFYERKNIIYVKNFKLTKKNTFNSGFCNRFFSYYRSLPIFYKWLDFNKSRLIFAGIILDSMCRSGKPFKKKRKKPTISEVINLINISPTTWKVRP